MGFFLIHLLLLSSFANAEDACDRWFLRAKIAKGKECELKCAMIGTDMGTFDCPARCDEFCKDKDVSEKVLGALLYYPFLTQTEKRLVRAYPKESIEVYKAKRIAEKATERRFRRNDQGDESDAFRHFVWAGAMRLSLNAEVTKKFLDAHESAEPDADSSRSMDLANNRAGLLAAERLSKEGRLNQDEIEKAALDELKNKSLIVLKPKGGPN